VGTPRRKCPFHKWRHFFNTTLRMGNVADSKVRELTGHKSEAMTELYTHFDPREFIEVRRIQEGILTSEVEEIAEASDEGRQSPA
jgi:integrase